MLRAFTYGFNAELTSKEYRNIRQKQVELENLYIDQKDIATNTFILEILSKLVTRTLFVFAFFVLAHLLRSYGYLG